jgi:hypothetical protein
MQSVKQSLRARAIADATLVAALGGQYFYHRNPATSLSQLLTDATKAVVTYWLVVGTPDEELPRSDELYQMDIWSKTADKNDAVAELLVARFDQKPLAMTGRRLGRIVHVAPVLEFYEPETELHHKAIQFRIISYAAS